LVTGAKTIRDYKELIPLGTLNPIFRKRVINASPPSSFCTPSILKQVYPEDWNSLHIKCGQYFYNRPCEESIEIAEMKIDEVRPWPVLDECRALAQAVADKLLELPLTARIWSHEETIEHMKPNLEKGPSIPWKFLGFKSRAEVLESSLWNENYEDINFLKNLWPLYESCGKEELAAIADLHDKKVRTFQTTSMHLLYWQLRLFGEGTQNLKKYKWSKYGFNPFYGGTDKWYREINVLDENGKILYRIRMCWDISGYDRKIFLHWVADRRLRFWKVRNPSNKFEAHAEWVAGALKYSVLIFLNGDIVIRKRGNNSGSGTTTANNIEAGFELVADLLIYTYYKKMGEYPPYDLVEKQLVALFGDDNAMFLMDCFDLMLDESLVKKRLYEHHGLVCKWIVGGVERLFGDLPFLGFTFSPYKDFFIPKWNLERLLHPILYTPNKKPIGAYLQ